MDFGSGASHFNIRSTGLQTGYENLTAITLWKLSSDLRDIDNT